MRIVIGAYKATSIKALEIETHIIPLNLFVEERVACIITRLLTYRKSNILEIVVDRIRRSKRDKKERKTAPNITLTTALRT